MTNPLPRPPGLNAEIYAETCERVWAGRLAIRKATMVDPGDRGRTNIKVVVSAERLAACLSEATRRRDAEGPVYSVPLETPDGDFTHQWAIFGIPIEAAPGLSLSDVIYRLDVPA